MPEARPNIVFINVDQMRYDCMSILGHPVVETPHLDMLAHRGVRFTNAFSGVMSCIGARAAIHTGMNQRHHGRVGYRDGVPWDYPVTLAGELTRAGYQSRSVGKMHVHPQRWKAGFEDVVLHDGHLGHYGAAREDDYADWLREQVGDEVTYFDHGLEANAWVARPWHLPEHMHPTNWVVSRSIDFVRGRDSARPFFLFMSFVRPHAPLDPPQVYWDQYIRQEMPAPPMGDWVDSLPIPEDRWQVAAFRARLDERAQHRAQAAYYALITHLDHQIGRFIIHLKDLGLYGNTMFVFCSDHGELMGDHTLFRKALPYSGSAQVPMFLCGPASLGIEGGRKIEQVTELRDIMPTLLDAAGAAIPDTVDGASLMPLARGEEIPWRPYVHGEHSMWQWANHYITDGRYKYVWYSQSGAEQFFDIANDRQEIHDLSTSDAHVQQIDEFRRALAGELDGREEGYSDGKTLRAGCTPVNLLSHVAEGRGE